MVPLLVSLTMAETFLCSQAGLRLRRKVLSVGILSLRLIKTHKTLYIKLRLSLALTGGMTQSPLYTKLMRGDSSEKGVCSLMLVDTFLAVVYSTIVLEPRACNFSF